MFLSFISVAHAMAPSGDQAGQGSIFTAMFPLILMFAIFYFLLIRPQQKRAKQHRELIENLKRDDQVVTSGGIHGRITGIADDIITIEIAPNVKIKVARPHIAGLSDLNKQQKE